MSFTGGSPRGSAQRAPRRPSNKFVSPPSTPRPQGSGGNGGLQMTFQDLERITNPSLPSGRSAGSVKKAPASKEEFELKHDALLIVEQKAPNTLRIPSDADCNMNRYIDHDNRPEALKTLPLAFPPIRFRRGETIDEYIESVTKPWEEARRMSASPETARRMSASGNHFRQQLESMVGGGAAATPTTTTKKEQLKQRHQHHVSLLWRQVHASKADIISGDEASKSLQNPLLESCTLAAIAAEQRMVQAVSVSCKEGIAATSRGLVVPYQYYTSLVQQVHGAIDRTFTSFFQFASDEEPADAMSIDKVNQIISGVRDKKAPIALRSLLHRNHTRGQQDVASIEETLQENLPPVGHPSRHSLVAVKTAVNVAILWRMLEQVQGIVPGMDAALGIFRELMPLMYVDFDRFATMMPTVSSLAEQVKQLVAIPLTCVTLQRAEANETQLLADVQYLRKAMENWSFTIWRHYNSIERRKGKYLESLHDWFDRFDRRRSLASCFYEWRYFVFQEKTKNAMSGMKDKYRTFVANAQHAATEAIPMSMNRAIAANQAKFQAQKLAATASHAHKKKFATSVVASSPPLATRREATPPTTTTATARSPPVANLTGGDKRKSVGMILTAPSSDRSTERRGLSPPQPGDGATPTSLPPSERNSPIANDDANTAANQEASVGGDHSPHRRDDAFFEEVLTKLQTVEDVSGHLREFIALQRKTITKLETDKYNLTESLKKAQNDALILIDEKLKLHNQVQDRDLKIRDQLRQILRLKAKVRLHRHRHWRQAAMKILAGSLQVTNSVSEEKDRLRMLSEASTRGHQHLMNTMGSDAMAQSPLKLELQLQNLNNGLDDEDDIGEESDTEQQDPSYHDSIRKPSEAERVFGRYAPLVLSAPSQLPDALVIIKDWANQCLDDLQVLDGVGGMSLSQRFSTLTFEARDGVMFSRLLFYLALPRYQRPAKMDELEDVSPDCAVNRQRLLQGKGVQLHSPFPTYEDCFGDLIRYSLSKRMAIVLNFASDLLSGCTRLSPEQLHAIETMEAVADAVIKEEEAQELQKKQAAKAAKMSRPNLSALSSDGGLGSGAPGGGDYNPTRPQLTLDDPPSGYGAYDGPAFPVSPEFLPQYVDPILLCEGSKSAIVTFLAILYVRFSHPFNHKAQETLMRERELMKVLLKDTTTSSVSDAVASLAAGTLAMSSNYAASPLATSNNSGNNNAQMSSSVINRGLEQLLMNIEDEEKSPWQIFLDKCKPFFQSPSHMFVLDGNFWSSMAIESADMLEVFSAMTSALQQSLLTHRFHVTMMCLVPLISSSGISRGAFCGQHASATNYLYQRTIEGEDICINPLLVLTLVSQRKELPSAPTPKLSSSGKGAAPAVSEGPAVIVTSPPTAEGEGPIPALAGNLEGSSIDGTLLPDDISVAETNIDDFGSHPCFLALSSVLRAYLPDLVKLFLQRATINASMLTPTLSLAGWRMLWMDCGLCPDRLSIDTLTMIFSETCAGTMVGINGGFIGRSGSVVNNGGGGGGRRTSSSMESSGPVSNLPIGRNLMQEMGVDDFCEGVVRVAHFRFAPFTVVQPPADDAQQSLSRGVSPAPNATISPAPPTRVSSALSAISASMQRLPSATVTKPPIAPVAQKVFVSLHEAFTKLICEYLLPLSQDNSPYVALQNLRRGVATQDLLRRRNAELLAVFQAYSKVYLGLPSMEKEDALRMVKDAGLATAELSYQVVSELFNDCCVKRTICDQGVMQLMDPYHVEAIAGGTGGSSTIGASFMGASGSVAGLPAARSQSVANSNNPSAGPTGLTRLQHHQIQQATMDRYILDFSGFIDLLMVLMVYKYPNPFHSMFQKFELFLERSIIAPLRFRVEQANRAKARRKEGNNKDDAVASPLAATTTVQPPAAPATSSSRSRK